MENLNVTIIDIFDVDISAVCIVFVRSVCFVKQYLFSRAQLFKTNDVISFVKILNINISNTLLFFVEKM